MRKQSVEQIKLLEEYIKRGCERRYINFFREAWNILEPQTPLIENWHFEYICDELQFQIERINRKEKKKYDLIINIPPRSAKSSIITKMLNVWAWINYPHMKFVTASYDAALSLEHATDTRRIIESDWFQERWGNRFNMTTDQNVKGFFKNNCTGFRIATSVGGSGTGRGGDIIIADDPISAKESESEKYRQRCITWWDRTMFSRLDNLSIGLRIVVMQRLHEEDLTGWILGRGDRKYKHICIPAEESDNIKPSSLKKKYKSGLFFGKRFNKKFLEEAKRSLGSYSYAGQYQQRPAPAEGGMFKRHYWRYWKPVESGLPDVVHTLADGTIKTISTVDLPETFDNIIDAWDLSFKGTAGSDRCSGQKWGCHGVDKFLLSHTLGNYEFTEVIEQIKRLRERDLRTTATLIEDAANGPAAMSQLRNTIYGLIPVKALSTKTARALDGSRGLSVLAQVEAGNLYLPHPGIAPWVEAYIEEFALFPMGKNDDQVDSTVYAIQYLSNQGGQIVTINDIM